MGQPIFLESFDFDNEPQSHERGTYQDGYDAGMAAAQALHETDQDALSAEIVQSISDLHFSYAEARAEVTRSLAPLLNEVLCTVIPSCVDKTFIARIVDILDGCVATHLITHLKIGINPRHARALARAIEPRQTETNIIEDQSLGPNTVVIQHDQGEQIINLEHVVQQIEDVLSNIHTSDMGHSRNE